MTVMDLLLSLAFLFWIGASLGWCVEVVFRRFFSSRNPERKWLNPGFCTGPWLPLYGSCLCVMYLICSAAELFSSGSETASAVLSVLLIAVCMTVIEYITGLVLLRGSHIRLWDYSQNRWNIQGIICPKFSLIWALLGAAYVFLIHPRILFLLDWLSRNLAFSFIIGVFFGVFLVDVCHACHIVARIRQFAKENDVVVRYETAKAHIRRRVEEQQRKYHFFRPFTSDPELMLHLAELKDLLEEEKNAVEQRIRRKK